MFTLRENGLTSSWSFVTREFGEPTQKAKQMTAELSRTAGAAFRETLDWQAINWQQVHENVRRLQARIVKATQPRLSDCETASCKGRLKGLSCMRGNSHV